MIDDDLFAKLSRFAWFEHSGYVKARVKPCYGGRAGGHTYLHRYIMRPPAGYVVDHINGDPLDNRRCNLQIVTTSRNIMKGRLALGGGVYYDKGRDRWHARIRIDGKRYNLGAFKSKEKAEAVLIAKRREAWDGPMNELGAVAQAQ